MLYILGKHYLSKSCYKASGEPSRRQYHDQEALSVWSPCNLQCHLILTVATTLQGSPNIEAQFSAVQMLPDEEL